MVGTMKSFVAARHGNVDADTTEPANVMHDDARKRIDGAAALKLPTSSRGAHPSKHSHCVEEEPFSTAPQNFDGSFTTLGEESSLDEPAALDGVDHGREHVRELLDKYGNANQPVFPVGGDDCMTPRVKDIMRKTLGHQESSMQNVAATQAQSSMQAAYLPRNLFRNVNVAHKKSLHGKPTHRSSKIRDVATAERLAQQGVPDMRPDISTAHTSRVPEQYAHNELFRAPSQHMLAERARAGHAQGQNVHSPHIPGQDVQEQHDFSRNAPEQYSQTQHAQNHGPLPISPAADAVENETRRPSDTPLDLDYDEAELFQMEYTSLKSQPFDTDPRVLTSTANADLSGEALNHEIKARLKGGKQEQEQFFASLPIEQWEDAGEWFLDQFAKITQRMKATRQNKRKLARAFESELDKRHELVTKKRAAIKSAVEGMRASGGKVLQGTPKKHAIRQ